jgi:hypothetical protein
MRTEVLACRVSAREAEAVREKAHEKGTTVSDELRQALRGVLSDLGTDSAGSKGHHPSG